MITGGELNPAPHLELICSAAVLRYGRSLIVPGKA
jgi:hypothetical protein